MADLPQPPEIRKPPSPSTQRGRSVADTPEDAYSQSSASRGGDTSLKTPNPYLDLSNLTLPTEPQEIYEYCRYLAGASAIHKAYVTQMSTIPVTDIRIKPRVEVSEDVRGAQQEATRGSGSDYVEDPRTRQFANFVTNKLRLRRFNQRASLYLHTYDAAVITLNFPFTKMFRCKSCGHSFPGQESEYSRETGQSVGFRAKCPSCGHVGRVEVSDKYDYNALEEITLQVLDTEQIHSLRNDFTGKVELYYEIPEDIKDRLRDSDVNPDFLFSYPQEYLHAAVGTGGAYYHLDGDRPVLRLIPGSYYLLTSPHMPVGSNGLPIPQMLATFKDTWLLRKLMRASEAVANQHIVPLEILFPDATGTKGGLFQTLNVSRYMPLLHELVSKHAKDPNIRGVLPFPVGRMVLGGEGKALLLSQEIRVLAENIMAGLGAPLEFLFGGLSYSGSSVSIKQLEKKFEDLRIELRTMNQWVVDRITERAGYPGYEVSFADLRIGDDLPFQQMLGSMVQASQLSLETLHDEMGINTVSERNRIDRDMKFQNQLRADQAKVDIESQERSQIAQANAEATAAISAARANLDARVEAAQQIRDDSDLLQSVLSSPDLAAQLLGSNAPELATGQGPENLPVTPNPESVYSSPEDTAAAIETQAPTEETVADLVRAMGRIDPTDWPHAQSILAEQYGSDIANAVNARLMAAKAGAGQMPTEQPGVRDASIDY
jgi:hypothetical protein